MFQEIHVIDEDNKLTRELRELFADQENLRFVNLSIKEMQFVYRNLPQLIIINEDNINADCIKVCEEIRNNEDNNVTPIIVWSSKEDKEFKMKLAKNYVEYYVAKSMGMDYLYYRIRNIFRLLVINRTISPLTGLPGNIQIQTELKKRLSRNEEFTVLYLDLDNFKSYNDIYGFLKGDEIIRFTARTISQNINNVSKADAFVGHIGGDDFVAILGKNIGYEKLCQNIISEFDRNVTSFFAEDDLKRGYLKVENRKGKKENFPLTTISIGVVIVNPERFSNVLQIGEIGAQVKHVAKKYKKSCYAIDRRKH